MADTETEPTGATLSSNGQAPSYIQRIIFGSPGTGKSWRVREKLLPQLGIDPDGKNCIQTVFHPEYSYGDFMGKLMPLSEDGKVEYNYYEGHFLKALAQAYSNILTSEEQTPDQVALVIDEINRGNSAAIFGTAFQLLDRDPDGWSEYAADVSEMEFNRLMEIIGIDAGSERFHTTEKTVYRFDGEKYVEDELDKFLKPRLRIRRNQVRLPSNLSLIATMNTSDHSIFHMDSAFKRRWEWQYMKVNGNLTRREGNAFDDREAWSEFVQQLNWFIKDNHAYVRNVEDRLVGHRYINAENRPITYAEVQNKLMFFLWDSVFERSKDPIADLLDVTKSEIATFGDFAEKVEGFVRAIKNR